MSEDFEKLSVIDLRRIAKEKGVKLGAGINKQGIIEKLLQAGGEQAPQTTRPASRPVRSAAIITDDEVDDEDVPVLTPNPQPPRPAPRPAASSLSTISSKAPAFTMEGSRAWHNPRPYQNASPTAPRNQQNTWGTPRPAQNSIQQRPYSAAPAAPARSAPVYPQRFGPNQPADAPQQPPVQDYRPANVDYQPGETAPVAYHRPASAPGMSLPELLSAGDVGDGEGVLELHPDGYGILRANRGGKKDIYISNAQIRRFSLRAGDYLVGKTRPQRENDRYAAMLYITDINGRAAEEIKNRPVFEDFTPLYPRKRINLSARSQDAALRLADLLSPIGFGQRALITCGPKGDKTGMLKKLAAAISRNYSKAQVKVLLIDVRPEEAAEMREQLKADVVGTTFDQSPQEQERAFDLLTQQAMRLVEDGKDVVVLVDSLTRMARVCNQTVPATARTLQGGLAAGAMLRAKKLFGAARNTKEGGTLTVIAFADTATALDQAALEEMQGTSNMELLLDGVGAVGFDPLAAHTQRVEAMAEEKEIQVADKIRGMFKDLSRDEAVAQLFSMLEKTSGNEDLIEKFDGWMSL